MLKLFVLIFFYVIDILCSDQRPNYDKVFMLSAHFQTHLSYVLFEKELCQARLQEDDTKRQQAFEKVYQSLDKTILPIMLEGFQAARTCQRQELLFQDEEQIIRARIKREKQRTCCTIS